MRKRGAVAEPQDASAALLTSVFKARKAGSRVPIQLQPKPTTTARLLASTSRQQSLWMTEPIVAATQIFDRIQQPSSPQMEEHLQLLIDHYNTKGFSQHSVVLAQTCIVSGIV